MNDNYADQSKFLADIISNLLGILIFVFVVISFVSENEKKEKEMPKENEYTFALKKQYIIHPYDDYYYVAYGKIAFVDYVQNIKFEAGHKPIYFSFGTVDIFKNEIAGNVLFNDDVDWHKTIFKVDWEKFKNLPPEKTTSVDGIVDKYIDINNRLPNFIVYESGMDLFCDLYKALKKQRINFRIFNPTKDFSFRRSKLMFGLDNYYYE